MASDSVQLSNVSLGENWSGGLSVRSVIRLGDAGGASYGDCCDPVYTGIQIAHVSSRKRDAGVQVDRANELRNMAGLGIIGSATFSLGSLSRAQAGGTSSSHPLPHLWPIPRALHLLYTPPINTSATTTATPASASDFAIPNTQLHPRRFPAYRPPSRKARRDAARAQAGDRPRRRAQDSRRALDFAHYGQVGAPRFGALVPPGM